MPIKIKCGSHTLQSVIVRKLRHYRGFGQYHYYYESSCEGDAAVIAFSPRKQHLVVYIMPGLDYFEILLTQLGKHKQGKSCLYINKLSDINWNTLNKYLRYQ